MKTQTHAPFMAVKLRESTVTLLMAQRANADETLDAIVARLAAANTPGLEAPPLQPETKTPSAPREPRGNGSDGKYAVEMLGEPLRASTLGEMFAKVVDTLYEVAPDAVERLSKRRARKRAFVAKDRNAVHPGRPELPTLPSRTGWWVSANVGTEDLQRALRALCEASNLEYDTDIRFLGKIKPSPQSYGKSAPTPETTDQFPRTEQPPPTPAPPGSACPRRSR